MAKIKATISLKGLERLLKKFPEALDLKTGGAMVDQVTREMRSMISKGVSPIEGKGRFPDYKAVAAAKPFKEAASQITKAIREGDTTLHKSDSKSYRNLARATEKRGYPYNVRKDFPDKRPKPVNLKLSGKFLRSLTGKVNINKSDARRYFEVRIGFFNKESVAKESGHRYGAPKPGDQPHRPIIPVDNEKLAKRLQLIIRDVIRKAIDRVRNK